MAYTVEALAPTTSNVPTGSQAQVLREERVVNGNNYQARLTAAQDKVANQSENGQTNISGANEAVESKPTEESVTLSPQMAAFARKEQKFRQQQQSLKMREGKLEAQIAEIAELKALKEKLTAEDYSGVESFIPYDKYTNYLINKEKGADPKEQALRSLEDKVNSAEVREKERVSKQFDAAVEERRQAIHKLVASDPQFARIKKANAEEIVVKHILDTWEHDSQELSVEDATKEVNAELIERAKKWSSLLEEPTDQTAMKKQLPPMKQGIKTLTNQMTTGDVKRAVKPLYLMSDGERYAEARRRAEEKIKQGK
jgi:hypothetical protein